MPAARFWNIPATEDVPFDMYIIDDERGLRAFDDGPEGSHPVTNSELLRLTRFRIWLRQMGEE